MTASSSTPDAAKRLVRCPSCGAGLRVRVELLGKRVQCPKCQHKWHTTVSDGNTILPPKHPSVHVEREPPLREPKATGRHETGQVGFTESNFPAVGSVIMPALEENDPSDGIPGVGAGPFQGSAYAPGAGGNAGGPAAPNDSPNLSSEAVVGSRPMVNLPTQSHAAPGTGAVPGGSSSRIKRAKLDVPNLDVPNSGSGPVARLPATGRVSADAPSQPGTPADGLSSPSRPPPTRVASVPLSTGVAAPRPALSEPARLDGGSSRGVAAVSQKSPDSASPNRPSSIRPGSSVVAVGAASRSGPSPQASAVEGLNPLVWIGKSLGQFTVRSFLGKGGMGTVYEGADPLLDRPVAIKILSPTVANDPDALRRFLHEARSAARVAHPNLVSVYAAGQDQGVTFLAMELVRGRSCAERIKADGPCDPAEATRIAMLAARGLAAAHAAGIIHRDVKPANLMLDKNGSVKVADFGLAKSADSGDSGVTKLGEIVGTPSYMSPEQCRGDKLTFHTDIYSLGATYFALLTGRPPFTAENHTGLMYKHVHEPVPDPRSFRPELPASCRRVLRKSMAKSVAERYANADEMADDLEALLVEIETGVPNTLAEIQEAIEVAASAVAAETGHVGKPSRLSSGRSVHMLAPPNKPGVLAELAGGIDLDQEPTTVPALRLPPQAPQSLRAYANQGGAEVAQPTGPSAADSALAIPGTVGDAQYGLGRSANRRSLRKSSLTDANGGGLSLWRIGIAVAIAVPVVLATFWAAGRLTPPPDPDAPPRELEPTIKKPLVTPSGETMVLFGPGEAAIGPLLNRQAGWKLRDDYLVFEHGGPPPDGWIGLEIPETADFRFEIEAQWPGHGKPDEALLEVHYRRGGSPLTWCGVVFRPRPDADTRPEDRPMLYYNDGKDRKFLPLSDGVRWGEEIWNVLTLEAIGREHRVLINGVQVQTAMMPIRQPGRILVRAEGATVRIRKWTLTMGLSGASP